MSEFVTPQRVRRNGERAGKTTVRVLIVVREPLLRRGLTDCLAADPTLDVVGATSSASEGSCSAGKLRPDVALIGTTLLDAPVLTVVAEWRRRFPTQASVVVTATDSDENLFAAISGGASAYCATDIAEAELISLVKRAAAGELVIDEQVFNRPAVATRVIARFREHVVSNHLPLNGLAGLTKRELNVLRKASDGMNNAEIAQALGISPATVKNHFASIQHKLVTKNRTQAVVMALEHGWF